MTVSIPTCVAADFAGTAVFTAFSLPALQTNSGFRMNSGQTAINGVLTQTFCLNLITLAGALCKEKNISLCLLAHIYLCLLAHIYLMENIIFLQEQETI